MRDEGSTDKTPEAAYRMLHERVRGVPPSAGMPSLSAAQYDTARVVWLDERGIVARPGVAVWPPTSQTLMKRLGDGSWARAMEALGLSTNTGRARGASAFTDDDYRRSVRDFLTAAADDEDGEVTSTSFASYAAWAKTVASDAAPGSAAKRPSGAAVRQHFGSWAAAQAAVES